MKTYKYRIYPDKNQAEQIDKTIDACRLIYNLALETKIWVYKTAKINLSAIDLINQLPELKAANPWMKEIDSQSLQASIRQLDKAFNNFYNGNGFPKFKNKRNSIKSFQCPANTRRVDFYKSRLTIPKIPDIPIRICRRFDGMIKNIAISKTASGKYFASVVIENRISIPAKKDVDEKYTIGIDVGIKSFVVTSDGRKFEPNRKLKDNLKRLKCLQRRASRKKKDSNNRKKSNLCVAILHEKITNQRIDYIHKVTTQLIRDNQAENFVIEDLGVVGMVKNRKLSQAISDVSFGRFFQILKYKCDWYGKSLIKIDRWAPSSKRCYNCGKVNNTLTLSHREWVCNECGSTHDRDYNAAKNIKWYGLQQAVFNVNTPVGSRDEPVEP